MANTFNPQKNLDGWIQDDWESDDYGENRRSDFRRSVSEQKTEEKDSGWLWALAIALYVLKSPLFWIGILVLGFWIDR